MALAAQRMNDFLNTAVTSPNNEMDSKSGSRVDGQKKPQSDGRMNRNSKGGANTSQGLVKEDMQQISIPTNKQNALRVARAASETRDITNDSLADQQNTLTGKKSTQNN